MVTACTPTNKSKLSLQARIGPECRMSLISLVSLSRPGGWRVDSWASEAEDAPALEKGRGGGYLCFPARPRALQASEASTGPAADATLIMIAQMHTGRRLWRAQAKRGHRASETTWMGGNSRRLRCHGPAGDKAKRRVGGRGLRLFCPCRASSSLCPRAGRSWDLGGSDANNWRQGFLGSPMLTSSGCVPEVHWSEGGVRPMPTAAGVQSRCTHLTLSQPRLDLATARNIILLVIAGRGFGAMMGTLR